MRETKPSGDDLFLPDFCDMSTVIAVVLIGELLACVLVLAPDGGARGWLERLAMVSLMVQWIALSSVAALCLVRTRLTRLGNTAAGIASYGLILVITAGLSQLAYTLVSRPVLDLGSTGGAGHLEFLGRNLGVAAIVAAVALRYLFVQHQWKSNLESEAGARIQALQSRIRPHFLFNSMNTIASLTRSDPALAEQVTEDLADLFRVSLSDARIPVALASEIDVCRQYLRIEQQRLGDRVAVSFDVDDLPRDAQLPALSLQPLVENAVYHGIEPAPEGGTIALSGASNGARLSVRIENTTPASVAGTARESHAMAQDNVAQRLVAFFGDSAVLRVQEGAGRYAVELDIPYQTSAAAAGGAR